MPTQISALSGVVRRPSLLRAGCRSLAAVFALAAATVFADPPGTAYIFPAGGQRGTTVEFRVGGLNLHEEAPFEMLGAGIESPALIRRTKTIWFEGPLL